MRVALLRVVHPCGALPRASLPRLSGTVRHVRRAAPRPRRLSISHASRNEELDETRLEQFGPENDAEIAPEEWEVIQYMADRLFPEGLVDWEGLWNGDSYPKWFDQWWELLQEQGVSDASLPEYEASVLGQSAWLKKALKYLETRPDYMEPMPDDWAGPDYTEEITYGKEFDPDWNDTDFYAMMQKRKARERQRRAWRKWQREEIGKYRYVDTISLDCRIPEEEKLAYQWTDEEMWDIITQNGRAYDPRTDKQFWVEKNPNELPDWAGQGVVPVDEIDEFLAKSGRLVDSKDDLGDANITLQRVRRLEEVYPGGLDPSLFADSQRKNDDE